MTTFKGKDGTMSVGATVGTALAVGELRSFEIETKSASTEATRMGQDWEVHVPTIKSWSGSAEVWWDHADTGQDALVVGAVVHLNMFPAGNGAPVTDVYLHGDAIIESVSQKQSHDGLVERSVTFKGTGNLVEAAA